jgi:hypothetical protein
MLLDGWRSLTEPAVHRAGPGGSLLPVVSWSRLPGSCGVTCSGRRPPHGMACHPRVGRPAFAKRISRRLSSRDKSNGAGFEKSRTDWTLSLVVVSRLFGFCTTCVSSKCKKWRANLDGRAGRPNIPAELMRRERKALEQSSSRSIEPRKNCTISSQTHVWWLPRQV